MSSINPLLTPSTLQYEMPNFDIIKPEHFPPALDAGMAQQLSEVDDILRYTTISANSAVAATFANTIEKLELSGQLLWRAKATLLNLCAANTNSELQAIEQSYAPKFAQHHDAIYLNRELYQRVHAVYMAREALSDHEQVKLT